LETDFESITKQLKSTVNNYNRVYTNITSALIISTVLDFLKYIPFRFKGKILAKQFFEQDKIDHISSFQQKKKQVKQSFQTKQMN
jgi:hypothetical protein